MRRSIAHLIKPAVLLLSALLLLGATAGVAGAGKKPQRVSSKITLKLNDGAAMRLNPVTFEGNVRAGVGRCERGRRVELTYKPAQGEAQPFGEKTTDGRGHYEIPVNAVPPGRYVATVLRKKKGDTVCKGAKSDPVIVEPMRRRSATAAAKPKETTKVTARFSREEEGALVGNVKSVKSCEPGRKLLLINESGPNGPRVEARTRSKRSGRYSFGRVFFALDSDYTVKAEERSRSRVVCRAGRARVPLS